MFYITVKSNAHEIYRNNHPEETSRTLKNFHMLKELAGNTFLLNLKKPKLGYTKIINPEGHTIPLKNIYVDLDSITETEPLKPGTFPLQCKYCHKEVNSLNSIDIQGNILIGNGTGGLIGSRDNYINGKTLKQMSTVFCASCFFESMTPEFQQEIINKIKEN